MKKITAAILLLATLLSVTACQRGPAAEEANEGAAPAKTAAASAETTAAPAEGQSRYAAGMDVIHMMSTMAGSEAYRTIVENDDTKELLRKVGEMDYNKTPDNVYQITIKNPDALFMFMGAGNLENLPKELRAYMEKRARANLSNLITAQGGTTQLVAASVCTYQKAFVNPELKDDATYLYVFSDAYPVIVDFSAEDDGAVLAGGSFILRDDFPCDTPDAVKKAFTGVEVTVETVEPPVSNP